MRARIVRTRGGAPARATMDYSGWPQPQQSYGTSVQAPQSQFSGGQGDGVGLHETTIVVSGCTHNTVGPTIRGTYVRSGDNHGKPTYKRDSQVNGLDVMMYFWDERDGPAFSGWWFGPMIGGDQVWAYHPSKQCTSAPKSGWKVPYDGPVDATLLITGKQAAASQSSWQPAPQAALNQYPQQQNSWQMGGQGNYQQGFGQPQQQQWQSPEDELRRKQQQQLLQQQLAQKQQQELRQRQQQQLMEQQRRMQEMKMQQESLKKQQMEQQRKQLEENRKRLEEANKKRIEEQQRKMHEMRAKQDEEKKKREEDMTKRREEQRAAMTIRKVIQRVRSAKEENIEDLENELTQELEKELENCGDHKDKVKSEAETAVEQAKKRIEQLKELKIQEQAAREKAEELIKNFESLIEEAESAKETLVGKADSFNGENPLSDQEIANVAEVLEEATKEAKAKAQVCMDFMLKNNSAMKGPASPVVKDGQSASSTALPKLYQRVNENSRAIELTLAAAKTSQAAAVKKSEAHKKSLELKALFEKYDADKDGMLNKKEVSKYAKGVYDFVVPADATDLIWKVLVPDGAKGVKLDDFQRLKVVLGVAREKILDAKRRENREARDKELAELKAELQEKVKEAGSPVDEAVAKATEAEAKAKPPTAGAGAVVLLGQADDMEQAVKAAKDGLAEARKVLEDLKSGVDPDLLDWVTGEVRKQEARLRPLDGKLVKAANTASRIRETAKKKDAEELQELRSQAVMLLRSHQTTKKLTKEQLFAEIDTNKDGRIEASEFLAFFNENGQTPESKDAKDTETADENGKGKLAPEDVSRLFAYLDMEDEGFISKEDFVGLVRLYMKVVKDTVITDAIGIKDSKTIRRLEVDEVVEVLQGPVKEGTVEVNRIQAKVMKDGIEGWITTEGNQGTKFLAKSSPDFKVVKETILTDSFDLSGGSKDNARKIKETTRKLKVGEIVEAIEWPRKDDSGLMRMQCRVKSDGTVGWATSVGNTGTVFLEMV